MGVKKLGRGLDALLISTVAIEKAAERPKIEKDARGGQAVSMLGVDVLFPSRFQPREGFDEAALEELAASIKENGVLQPIIARVQPEGYEIIAGERRWRAAQLLGMNEVPVIIRDVPDNRMLELALVENIQRENLNPMEAAQAYSELMNELSLTHEQVADRVGKSRATVTNFLRLLDLPDEVREHVSRGTISMGHARALLSLESAAGQIALAEKTASSGLSVREVERIVQAEKGRPKTKAAPLERPAHIIDVEDRLRKSLGTKVRVSERNGRGKIVLEFYTLDEFDRLMEALEK